MSDVVTVGHLLSSRAIAACFCAGRVEDALCCVSRLAGVLDLIWHTQKHREALP